MNVQDIILKAKSETDVNKRVSILTDAVTEMEKTQGDLKQKSVEDQLSFLTKTNELHIALRTEQENKQKSEADAKNKETAERLAKLEQGRYDFASQGENLDLITKSLMDKKDKRAYSEQLKLKAVADMTRANVTNASGGGVHRMTYNVAGVVDILRYPTRLLTLFGSQQIEGMSFSYLEKKTPEGAADYTAEGANYSQIDLNGVETDLQLRSITAYLNVTKQAWRDAPFLRAMIDNELDIQLNFKIEDAILNGANTGEQWRGIVPASTASVMTDFSATIPYANQLDVLACAMSNVANNGAIANTIIVNPVDYAKMLLIKSTTGDSIQRFGFNGGVSFAGMEIVQCSKMTKGNYLICDSRLATVFFNENINMFDYMVQTSPPQKRFVHAIDVSGNVYFPANYAPAFVKGTFATDMGLINKS